MANAFAQEGLGRIQSTAVSDSLTSALACTKLTESMPKTLPEEPGKPEERNAQVIKRVLSAISVVPSASNFAAGMQQVALQSTPEQGDLRVIGADSCGTVFEIPGSELAFKKGTEENSIWTDYCYTNRVHNAVQDVRATLREVFPELKIRQTPLCWEFAQAGNGEFWAENLRRFPKDHRTKQPIFMVDSILPIPWHLYV